MNACLRFGNCNDWQNNNAHVRICYISRSGKKQVRLTGKVVLYIGSLSWV